jgi:hypothetical protein
MPETNQDIKDAHSKKKRRKNKEKTKHLPSN